MQFIQNLKLDYKVDICSNNIERHNEVHYTRWRRVGRGRPVGQVLPPRRVRRYS